ncbi:ankyrin repeat domain-containing protein [Desulfomonile tiedjei]|uniref:Ankyrin repeat-containing protein n=1 Tax=Desulfomonile tiedjei (strain ATCC 49306 / DSM 6799 / DCB-1) TaxID=706587 RepID=I4C906_DESTA|nr:ankyrin repeat domain-containing protein [Desulfomonile tiedjei]AFM26047.1 ankyrin repeat-containing protein [Desulfomonile tiedjei DSM 6799]
MQEDQNNRRIINWDIQLFNAVKIKAPAQAEKLLSRRRVSPDCRNEKGGTPLMHASEAGDAAMVGLLLRHGADPNAVDFEGETPLVKAAYGGHLDVVELLMSHGADGNLRNNDDMTPLAIAQEMGHDDVVAFLSEQSADSTSPIKEEIPTDPDDDGPITDGPAGALLPVAAAMAPSPQPSSYVPELDIESIPEMAESPYFKAQQEPEIAVEALKEEAASQSQSDGAEPVPESSGAGEQTESVWSAINSRHAPVLEKTIETRPAIPDSILAANDEKIVFDAWDHKMVRGINEKSVKVLDKAVLETGDHTINTVFKSSYMPVLKPRSQEYKRFRKLWKHPELLIDPRRWREWTGAAAVRRYCLAEGIDISPFSSTHFIEMYSMKDLKLILALAEDASRHNYTVRQLKGAIEQLREHKDDHDPGKEIIRTLDQPVPILEDPDLMALCTDKDRLVDELSKTERKRIRALIKARKPGLDEWKNLMDTLEGILSGLGEG